MLPIVLISKRLDKIYRLQDLHTSLHTSVSMFLAWQGICKDAFWLSLSIWNLWTVTSYHLWTISTTCSCSEKTYRGTKKSTRFQWKKEFLQNWWLHQSNASMTCLWIKLVLTLTTRLLGNRLNNIFPSLEHAIQNFQWAVSFPATT